MKRALVILVLAGCGTATGGGGTSSGAGGGTMSAAASSSSSGGMSSSSGGCVDGQSYPCTGAGGCQGLHICAGAGSFGSCVCPSSTSGGSSSGGVSSTSSSSGGATTSGGSSSGSTTGGACLATGTEGCTTSGPYCCSTICGDWDGGVGSCLCLAYGPEGQVGDALYTEPACNYAAECCEGGCYHSAPDAGGLCCTPSGKACPGAPAQANANLAICCSNGVGCAQGYVCP